MQVHTRAEWGAKPPKGPMDVQASFSEVFIHHADQSGAHVHDLAHAITIVRGIQAFHMNTRGWSDIGYHYVIVPQNGGRDNDYVFAGRRTGFVPAAQLDHNQNTIALCVVQKDPEPLTQATIRTLVALAERFPQAHLLRGHYEVFATECPGAAIRPHLDEIARLAHKRRK